MRSILGRSTSEFWIVNTYHQSPSITFHIFLRLPATSCNMYKLLVNCTVVMAYPVRRFSLPAKCMFLIKIRTHPEEHFSSQIDHDYICSDKTINNYFEAYINKFLFDVESCKSSNNVLL